MKKLVAKNFIFLTIGEFIARFFSFFLTLFIARVLGAQGLGQFSFAMSIIAYFTFFTDFGLTLLGTREIAGSKEEASKIGTNILFLQMSLAVILVIVLAILANTLPLDPTTRLLIIVLGMGLIPFALNLNYIFQAFQRMEFAALVKVVTQFTYVGLALIFLFFFRDITYAAVSNVIGNTVGAVLSVFLVLKWFDFKFKGLSFSYLKKLFILSLPMGVSAFLVQLFFNFDTTAIGFIKGVGAVGVYSAAYKLMLVISSFGYSYFGALFPIFSEKFKEGDIAKIKDVGETSLRVLFFAAWPIIAGILVTAPLLVKIFFKPEFFGATPILQVLVFNVLLIWLNNLFGSMLIAAGSQKLELMAVASGTLLNVALNILLIPTYGIFVAGVVSVLSQLVNFFVVYFLVLRKVKLNIFKTSYKSFINSAIMLAVLIILFSKTTQNVQTLVLEISVGVLFYFVLSLFTFSIPKQEVFFGYARKVLSERFGFHLN